MQYVFVWQEKALSENKPSSWKPEAHLLGMYAACLNIYIYK